MQTAKNVLNRVSYLRKLIEAEQFYISELYYETYGLHINCAYDGDQVMKSPTDPAEVLIGKIDALDRRSEKSREKIEGYIEELTQIEELVETSGLAASELAVVKLKFFNKRRLSTRDISNELNYSEAWVSERLVEAYRKIDMALVAIACKNMERTA